jgi:DNA polymerase-4
MSTTSILHVDMDAFYASVEQRDRPELRGRPVIVGGPAEARGVVSAASYEARAFGVHSAMPTATARRLCPHGVFLPVRMKHYAQVARQIREILLAFTPLVEPLSLDEAFLDVRGCEGLFGPGPDIARQIKARVRRETGLVASVGVAVNKFLAKLATDLGKPDGLVVIEPARVRDVLDPLPVARLWGVGAKAEKRLHALGVRTIGQLAALPERVLADHFGEFGRHLHQLAHGRDDRAVVPDEQARSVSTETTFARDVGDREALRGWLLELAEHLGQRVRRLGVRARTVELKARTSDFRTYLRSLTLPEPTDLTEEIWRAAAGLFEARVPDEWLPLRLLGVGVSGLVRDAAVQGHLFDDEWRTKQRALDQTLDAIRAQFGGEAIRRAGLPAAGAGDDSRNLTDGHEPQRKLTGE